MADTIVVSTVDSQMVDEPLWLQAIGGDAAVNYSAPDYRALMNAMWGSQGVVIGAYPNSCQITQRGAGANFSVDVAAGFVVITGDDTAGQGKFLVESRGVVNVPTPAAPGSGTRVHRLVAQIRDKQALGTGTYDWIYWLREDTGSGTPAEPASAVTLATVLIAAGQASVLNANITDKRVLAQPATGPQIYRAHGTGLQGIPTSTDTALWMDTDDETNPFVVKSGGSGSAASWTLGLSGIWRLSGGFIFVGTGSAGVNERVAWWAKSSDLTNTRYGGQSVTAPVGKGTEMQAVAVRRFVAGDAVSLACWQDTGGFLNIQNTTGSGFQPWVVIEYVRP